MFTCKSRTNHHGSSKVTPPLDSSHRAPEIGREILIADDDESVRNSIARLLRCHGYSTLTAASGTEALELAVQRKPPIILMDAQMPKMSGLDASRAIKAHATLADVQIIALSAAPIPQHEFGFLFTRTLQKPCPGAIVVAAIEAAIFEHCFRKVAT